MPQLSGFISSFLGAVEHPKNTLHEYLEAFHNKCQADILTWLDGWTKTKRSQGKEDWVRVVTSELAAKLGYCKATICTHLGHLLNIGVLIRRDAKLFPTDTAFEYQVVLPELIKRLEKNQPTSGATLDHKQHETSPLANQKQSTTELPTINPNLPTATNTVVVAFSKNEEQPGTLPEPPQPPPSQKSLPANENDSLSQENPEAALITESVAAAGIQLNSTIRALVLRYTLAEITAAIALLDKAGEKVRDKEAWFTECLRHGWMVEPSSKHGDEASIAVSDVDWAQDSDWEDWIEFMREQGVGGFIERGEWRNANDRRAIANWASHRNLIWGEDDV